MIFFANPTASHGRLTLKEAAALADVNEKFVRRTLETVLDRPSSKHGRRRFGVRDVVALRLLGSLPLRMDPKSTQDAVTVLTKRRRESGAWVREGGALVLTGPVRVVIPIEEIEADAARKLRTFRECARRVSVRDDVLGGEPTFEGTRIPVRHVGRLVLRGESLARLREDFPRLSDEQLEFAGWFARLGPPPGRPRKKLKLRRPKASR